MMKEPLPKKKQDYDFFAEYDALTGVVSATECTGLMYRPAEDESEAESYSDICSVPTTPNMEEEKFKEKG